MISFKSCKVTQVLQISVILFVSLSEIKMKLELKVRMTVSCQHVNLPLKIIITVDADTMLVLVMTTMRAWKDSILGVAEWILITMVGECSISWPELNIFRK